MADNYIVVEEDLRLIAGIPMAFDKGEVIPFTVGNIANIGYMEFNNILAVLLMSVDDIIDSIGDFETQARLKSKKHEIELLDLQLEIEDFTNMLFQSLGIIFRTSDIVLSKDKYDYKCVIIDKEIEVNRRNFKDLAYIIKLQNMPKDTGLGEEEFNIPEGSKARELAERMREQANKVEKIKNKDDDSKPMYLPDIISAVTAMSNTINKLNVWDLTLYQLYDEFARIKKIEEYKLTQKASMYSSDVELINWSEPL